MEITTIETKEKMKRIWIVNYGGKMIDFGTLKEARAFEYGLIACEFKESIIITSMTKS